MAKQHSSEIYNLSLDNSALSFRVKESYKTIRTNIMLSVIKEGCKVIIVSSSTASEGKTTTSINLALSFAEAEQRVLLIDADLRKPKIHNYFALQKSPGLTNYMSSNVNKGKTVDISDIIHPTDNNRLSVITSGSIPPNPAEILGSEEMAKFITKVSESYDYIIIDTPPISLVSDALPIIKESDGVVLVVRENASTYPQLEETISALEFVDAKILGFIVNFADSTRKKGYYKKYSKYSKYYKYDYAYGYGESSREKKNDK